MNKLKNTFFNIFKSFKYGFQKHKSRIIGYGFLCYSFLWTIIESATSILNKKVEGVEYYFSLVLISLLFGIHKIYQPRKISFKIPTSDTTVKIFYGDIFEQDGMIAIPVNEFFDSEIGKPVSELSLHGIMIKKILRGYSASFDQAIKTDLSTEKYEEVQEKIEGKKKKYQIGTTIPMAVNNNVFLLFASSCTNPSDCKAYADTTTVTKALKGLFSKARSELGGKIINIPLVASGLSGIGLPATQLLQLIILVLIEETKKQEISKEIQIVLHESRFEEIDLELIKNQWSN